AAYAVRGATVTTTSRLLSAAEPGTILVSDATYRLAQHSFAFESAGTVTAKGKTEPIVVHRVLGALAEPGSARGLAALGLGAPLVGRGGGAAPPTAALAGRGAGGGACRARGRVRGDAGGPRAGGEHGGRGEHGQVAPDRGALRAPRRR